MSKGRRVSFYAPARHVRFVAEWLLNEYKPRSTILGSEGQDQQSREHARIIAGWLLDQVGSSRQFKRRRIGIILPPMALKWLAANLPSWRRVSFLYGPLGSFGLQAGRAVPRRVGRPRLTRAQMKERIEPDYYIDGRHQWRLRARLKRTKFGQ